MPTAVRYVNEPVNKGYAVFCIVYVIKINLKEERLIKKKSRESRLVLWHANHHICTVYTIYIFKSTKIRKLLLCMHPAKKVSQNCVLTSGLISHRSVVALDGGYYQTGLLVIDII